MFSSYHPDDVTVLLKDISGMVAPLATREREALIQKGVHYSEMLPLEYEPSKEYLQAYDKALELYGEMAAQAVAFVAQWIWKDKGEDVVLVSLARAGTPVGILIKHYLEKKYQAPVRHYTISLIRGRGIDRNAMAYILDRHRPGAIQFVDGWTGKGAILRQLEEAMKGYPDVDPGLAVLSDPAGLAARWGTREDFLIASSCLNSTVSGLLSRTFYRKGIIGENDFHGAAFYKNLMGQDLTYGFIRSIEQHFSFSGEWHMPEIVEPGPKGDGLKEVEEICKYFHIKDVNLVKPSIGEATRVLLRRVPWKILVNRLDDQEHLGHLYQLAKEKGVEVEIYPLRRYRACGLIQSLADN